MIKDGEYKIGRKNSWYCIVVVFNNILSGLSIADFNNLQADKAKDKILNRGLYFQTL